MNNFCTSSKHLTETFFNQNSLKSDNFPPNLIVYRTDRNVVSGKLIGGGSLIAVDSAFRSFHHSYLELADECVWIEFRMNTGFNLLIG